MAYGIAVGAALSKAGAPGEEVDQVLRSTAPIAIQRIGKVAADRSKPRPIRLVFNTPQQKHTVLSYAKDLRQAGVRVDDDLTRAQQTERRGLDLDFQVLKRQRAPILLSCLASQVLQWQQETHMCQRIFCLFFF